MTNPHDVFIDPDDSWVPTMLRAIERGHYVTTVFSPIYGQAYPSVISLANTTAQIDTSDVQALTFTLRELAISTPINAVLTSRDSIILQTAIACNENRIAFTPVEAVMIARDKGATRCVLQQHGFHTPRFRLAKDLGEVARTIADVGFPCILKPVSGHLSMFCFRLEQKDEVSRVVADIEKRVAELPPSSKWIVEGGFICEEWLFGPIVSVEMALLGRTMKPITVAVATTQSENPCIGLGSVIPFYGNPNISAACVEYAKKVCKCIGLTLGVCDLEMVWTHAGPVLLEANPRRMGGEMATAYDLATGLCFGDVLLDVYSRKGIPIDNIDRRRTTVIRKIMPKRDGRVNKGMNRSWLSSFGPEVQFRNYSLWPSTDVQRLQVLGRILVVATDPISGFEIADKAIQKLQIESGIELIFGALPAIASEKIDI